MRRAHETRLLPDQWTRLNEIRRKDYEPHDLDRRVPLARRAEFGSVHRQECEGRRDSPGAEKIQPDLASRGTVPILPYLQAA